MWNVDQNVSFFVEMMIRHRDMMDMNVVAIHQLKLKKKTLLKSVQKTQINCNLMWKIVTFWILDMGKCDWFPVKTIIN